MRWDGEERERGREVLIGQMTLFVEQLPGMGTAVHSCTSTLCQPKLCGDEFPKAVTLWGEFSAFFALQAGRVDFVIIMRLQRSLYPTNLTYRLCIAHPSTAVISSTRPCVAIPVLRLAVALARLTLCRPWLHDKKPLQGSISMYVCTCMYVVLYIHSLIPWLRLIPRLPC